MGDLLTIGELADQESVTTHTLRYYDERGLVKPTTRIGGQRRYGPEAAHRLRLVTLCTRAGFTLAEVRELLDDDVDLSAQVTAKRHELEQRIAELRQAQELLDAALACGCSSLTGCGRHEPPV